MAAHMDILRHLVKNTEHKPDARAFDADGVKKKMRAADNSTENLSQPAFGRAYCSLPRNEKNGGTAAKKSFFQLIKFGLVGIGNTLIDMVISTVLSIVLAIPFTGGWTVYVSKVVGYCAGILNSYILNSRWTFKEERRQDAREIISFIAVNLGVLLVSLGLIWLFTNALHIDDWWMSLGLPQWLTKIINGERACMLLSTCICIIVNFIGNKLFVFKPAEAPSVKNDEKEKKVNLNTED